MYTNRELGYDLYLAHHGVKGMKWGVRRYQNLDGTLTLAGKKKALRKSRRAGLVNINGKLHYKPKTYRDNTKAAKQRHVDAAVDTLTKLGNSMMEESNKAKDSALHFNKQADALEKLGVVNTRYGKVDYVSMGNRYRSQAKPYSKRAKETAAIGKKYLDAANKLKTTKIKDLSKVDIINAEAYTRGIISNEEYLKTFK